MMLDTTLCWEIFQTRQSRYDGLFFVGVMTTKIYCRPSCSARPHRENVQFFASSSDAQAAGLRPCKRCHPDTLSNEALLVHRVSHYIATHLANCQLAQISRATGYSPFHINRQFKRILGITPRQYANALRQERLLQTLRQFDSIALAGEHAGYTSTSQMYYAQRRHDGRGIPTYRADIATSLGLAVILLNDRGLCFVGFVDTVADADALCQRLFPAVHLSTPPQSAAQQLAHICDCIEHRQSGTPEIALDIRMTAFQTLVWHALQQIPSGSTQRYQDIATAIGHPKASRAVAQACAQNPVAVIIPCHRAVHSDPRKQGYRWGRLRKQQLIDRELQYQEGDAPCHQPLPS